MDIDLTSVLFEYAYEQAKAVLKDLREAKISRAIEVRKAELDYIMEKLNLETSLNYQTDDIFKMQSLTIEIIRASFDELKQKQNKERVIAFVLGIIASLVAGIIIYWLV